MKVYQPSLFEDYRLSLEGAIAQSRPVISLINQEEEARIRELIALKTFPDKWDGDEPNGAELLPEVYPDGSVQPLIWS